MTSFPPALVLKGNYALSGKGKRLRTVLIGFQYIVSFALIVTAAFIFLQNRFMRNHELGIDKDQILVASLPQMPYHSSPYRKFDTQLKSFAEIDDIAYAKWELGGTEGYTQYTFRYKGNNYGHQYIDVTTKLLPSHGNAHSVGKRLPAQRFHLHLPAKLYRHAGPSERKRYPGRRDTRLFPWGMSATLKGYVNNVQLLHSKLAPSPIFSVPTVSTATMCYHLPTSA